MLATITKVGDFIYTFGPFVPLIILLVYWVIGYKWFKQDIHGDDK